MALSNQDFLGKNILQCSNPCYYVVFMPSEGYCFAGSFRFQCLYGEICVGGYKAKGDAFNEDNFVPFSVHNKGQLPMNFVPSENGAANSDLLFQRLRLIMEGSASDFEAFNHYSAVLLIDTSPGFVESFLTRRFGEFHKPLEKFKYVKLAGNCYIVQGLKMYDGTLSNIGNHISDPDTIDHAINFVKENGNVLMLAGNKDMGKSTLARYIVNCLVSDSSKDVYLLDTDIGQTEYTPPGCVSLFRVEKPILSKPFLHQKWNFTNTYCIGSLSPNSDMELYMSSIQQLMWEFQQLSGPNSFLIVNTHGWVENGGEDIMKRLLTYIRPTTILNLYLPGFANFDIPKLDFSQHYYQYQVVQRVNSQTSKEIDAKTWREYSITGYFANCLADERFGKPSPERTLANVMSYQVLFNKIALCFHHKRPPVIDNLIFSSLNCTIIALCGFASGVEKEKVVQERYICENANMPKVLTINDVSTSCPLIKCYGFGFIRAIDTQKKAFHVISPIPVSDCSKLEFFFIPDKIVTPCYMLDRDSASVSPYLVEFTNEDERQNAINSRAKCLRLLSSNFQNNTGFRSKRRANAAAGLSGQPTAKMNRK